MGVGVWDGVVQGLGTWVQGWDATCQDVEAVGEFSPQTLCLPRCQTSPSFMMGTPAVQRRWEGKDTSRPNPP